MARLIGLRSDQTIDRFSAAIAEEPADPSSQLDAYFNELRRLVSEPGFNGCPIIATATDWESTNAQKRAAKAHLDRHRELLATICKAATSNQILADEILILVEGATTIAAATGDTAVITTAHRAAKALHLSHLVADPPLAQQ